MPQSVIKKAQQISSSYYQLNEDFLIKRSDSYWSYSFKDKDLEVNEVPYGSLSPESASIAITAFELLTDKKIDFKSVMKIPI